MKKISTGAGGYMVFGMTIEGEAYQRVVSRVMAYSFFGPPAHPDMEACHRDGVRNNNVLSNLRWDTALGNAADKKLHGTDNRGATNPGATLSDKDVDTVVLLASQGIAQKEIAYRVGSNSVTVSHILTGRTWVHRTGIKYRQRRARVTNEIADEMRRLKLSGMRLQDIANAVGMSKAATFRHTAPSKMIGL